MKWRTHRALTGRALRRLGLGGDVIEACLEGVVEPDRREEYSLTITPRGRVRLTRRPHHSFWRASDAIRYIYKARRCFLEGRLGPAGYYLGQALHYIQDKCVERSIFAEHGELESKEKELIDRISRLETKLQTLEEKMSQDRGLERELVTWISRGPPRTRPQSCIRPPPPPL